MNNFLALLCLSLALSSCASKKDVSSAKTEFLSCPKVDAAKAPQLLWSTAGFSAPESVVFDDKSKSYYVSNVVGSPTEKDGQGWITKVSSAGKISKKKWAKNLNAPKGLKIRGPLLWATDIDQVRAFYLSSAKQSVLINVPEAKFLNDVAATNEAIYVSDMMTGKVHAFRKSPSQSVVVDKGLESPNGLVVAGNTMLVANWGAPIEADFSTKIPGRILEIDLGTAAVSPWTKKPIGNLDGIEFDGPDAVIASDWMAGKVLRITKSGDCITLLEGFSGAADLTYIPATRTLVVPLMGEDKVNAYKIPQF